jgi:hypothetical protein
VEATNKKIFISYFIVYIFEYYTETLHRDSFLVQVTRPVSA